MEIDNPAEKEKLKLARWTLHDLRRTYATGLQKLGVRLEVIESLLNHVSGTKAGIVGVYQRHGYMPEMRAAPSRTIEAQHAFRAARAKGLGKG